MKKVGMTFLEFFKLAFVQKIGTMEKFTAKWQIIECVEMTELIFALRFHMMVVIE